MASEGSVTLSLVSNTCTIQVTAVGVAGEAARALGNALPATGSVGVFCSELLEAMPWPDTASNGL